MKLVEEFVDEFVDAWCRCVEDVLKLVEIFDEEFVIMLWKYVMNNLSHKTILMFVVDEVCCENVVKVCDE